MSCHQFVSDVSVFSAAWHSKKAEKLIAFVKRYEHALLSNDDSLPSDVLLVKIKKLCDKLDNEFPKTLPLLVEMSRDQLYGGMQSKISIKPSRRDGSFSDSYWVIMTLIDVKNNFDFSNDATKSESLLVNTLFREGGDA